jgi:uncharacterized membrane protein YeaQ/YmgE (transglycosylase-associated protein family)
MPGKAFAILRGATCAQSIGDITSANSGTGVRVEALPEPCGRTVVLAGESNWENPAMGLFLWIILGWFVGLLANWMMGVKDCGGLVIIWLLGIGGAVLGGLVGSVFGLASTSTVDLRGMLVAAGSAILVLAAYHAFRGRVHSTTHRST